MAKQVVGDRMTVGTIVPAGAPVEEYEPRPDDAKRMSEARLVITNGLDLDKWVEPLLPNAKPGTPVVTVTDGLPDLDENPHMWLTGLAAHVERTAMGSRAGPSRKRMPTRAGEAYRRISDQLESDLKRIRDDPPTSQLVTCMTRSRTSPRIRFEVGCRCRTRRPRIPF